MLPNLQILFVVFRWLRDWWIRRQWRLYRHAARGANSINVALESLLHETGACRTALLVTKNGNGRPSPKKSLKSTAIFERHSSDRISAIEKWRNRPVTPDHKAMLARVLEDEHIRFSTEAMEDGPLKDLYLSDQIIESDIYCMPLAKRGVLYLSINYDAQSPPVNDRRRRIELDAHVATMRDLCLRHGEWLVTMAP